MSGHSNAGIIVEEIFNLVRPFQKQIDLIADGLLDKGLTKERIAKAILYGSGDPLEKEPWMRELREIRTRAFGVIVPRFSEFYSRGLLHNLPDMQDKQEHPTRVRGKKIDIPDILVNGFSVWNFPMEPKVRYPVHNHKVNVAAIGMSGTIRQILFDEDIPGVLHGVSDTIIKPGDISILDPGGPNTHTLINMSDTESASAIHIVGFSLDNKYCKLFHPIRELFEKDDKDLFGTKVDRVDIWPLDFKKEQPWVNRQIWSTDAQINFLK